MPILHSLNFVTGHVIKCHSIKLQMKMKCICGPIKIIDIDCLNTCNYFTSIANLGTPGTSRGSS